MLWSLSERRQQHLCLPRAVACRMQQFCPRKAAALHEAAALMISLSLPDSLCLSLSFSFSQEPSCPCEQDKHTYICTTRHQLQCSLSRTHSVSLSRFLSHRNLHVPANKTNTPTAAQHGTSCSDHRNKSPPGIHQFIFTLLFSPTPFHLPILLKYEMVNTRAIRMSFSTYCFPPEMLSPTRY